MGSLPQAIIPGTAISFSTMASGVIIKAGFIS